MPAEYDARWMDEERDKLAERKLRRELEAKLERLKLSELKAVELHIDSHFAPPMPDFKEDRDYWHNEKIFETSEGTFVGWKNVPHTAIVLNDD